MFWIYSEFSVRYYEYLKNKTDFIIVMELCDNNLNNILRKRKKGFSSEEIQNILIQLNKTFKILVSNKIIHRNIKLNNIHIKYIDNERKNFIVKLTDYFISEEISNLELCDFYRIEILTKVPEILEGKKNYYKCDLWSIGVIIYQLYFNEFPYKATTEVDLKSNIKKLGQKVLKKTDNEDLNNLIRGLLVSDSDKRLNWDKYFEHSFFCSIKKE